MITGEIQAPTEKTKQKYTSKWKSVPEFKGKLNDYSSTLLKLIC